MIFPMILLVQFSSIPVNAHALVIGYGDTTSHEYLCIYYIAALLNTFKNCWVGDFIMNSDMTGSNVDIVGGFLLFTILLPPLIALFLFNGIYNFYDALEVEKQMQEKCVAQTDNPLEVEQDTKNTLQVCPLSARWSSYFLAIHPHLFTQIWSRMDSKKQRPKIDEEFNLIECTKPIENKTVESYEKT
jgi:hypothetical protein